MNLLEIVQEFCDRRGLERPGTVVGSTDETIRQLKALANEVVGEITGRNHVWQRLQKKAEWMAVLPTSDYTQGLLTLYTYGFKSVKANTFWNKTKQVRVPGPATDGDWNQEMTRRLGDDVVTVVTGSDGMFRIAQGKIWIFPAPDQFDLMTFEYNSDWAILASDTSWKKHFTADDDIFVLGDDLLLKGLSWLWRREKGLSYSQEKLDWEIQVNNMAAADPNKGTLRMDACAEPRFGISAPPGSWNL